MRARGRQSSARGQQTTRWINTHARAHAHQPASQPAPSAGRFRAFWRGKVTSMAPDRRREGCSGGKRGGFSREQMACNMQLRRKHRGAPPQVCVCDRGSGLPLPSLMGRRSAGRRWNWKSVSVEAASVCVCGGVCGGCWYVWVKASEWLARSGGLMVPLWMARRVGMDGM